MRKLIMQMNISLDGFADHTVAIADDELHEFAADQLDNPWIYYCSVVLPINLWKVIGPMPTKILKQQGV